LGTYKRHVNANWNGTFELERIYPLRTKCQSDVERLVQFITDRAISLVLGGAARGFAHVGVLKAFHELAITIDMVCGNSMGALFGFQYTYGTANIDILRQRRVLFVEESGPRAGYRCEFNRSIVSTVT
jgi:NTE family protein/lysophospholipid hydrolase